MNNKITPTPILDFPEISTCNDLPMLVEFKVLVEGAISKLKDNNQVLIASSLNDQVRKINSRIEYLEHKDVWDKI